MVQSTTTLLRVSYVWLELAAVSKIAVKKSKLVDVWSTPTHIYCARIVQYPVQPMRERYAFTSTNVDANDDFLIRYYRDGATSTFKNLWAYDGVLDDLSSDWFIDIVIVKLSELYFATIGSGSGYPGSEETFKARSANSRSDLIHIAGVSCYFYEMKLPQVSN